MNSDRRARRRRSFLQAVSALLMLVLLGATSMTLSQTAEELTVELIDQRIAALRAMNAADDDERLRGYRAARQFLEQVDAQSQRAAVFLEALNSAPAREAGIQQRLDDHDDSYDASSEVQGFTAEEAAARLLLARAALADASEALAYLDRRLASRETRFTDSRARLVEIEQRLAALPAEMPAVSAAAPPSVSEATQWRDRAEKLALNAERRAEEARQQTGSVRYSLMNAERAELIIDIEKLNKLIAVLEATNTSEPAGLAELTHDIDLEDQTYKVAKQLVANDAALRDLTININGRLTSTRRLNDDITARIRALDEQFATARRIVEFAGESDVLGRALLNFWEEIDTFEIADPTKQLSREVGSAVMRRIDHEKRLSGLVSASSFVNNLLRQNGMEPETVAAASRGEILELARSYRERLRGVMTADSEYIQALGELENRFQLLQSKIREYRQYLEGLVIWIPNHPPMWELSAQSFNQELPFASAALARLEPAFSMALPLLFLLALILWRLAPRLAELQRRTNSSIGRPRNDAISFTLQALVAMALRALPVPLVLLALASALMSIDTAMNRSFVTLMHVAAWLVFALELLRIVTEPGGVGSAHFRWKAQTVSRLRDELKFINFRLLPLVMLAATANLLTPNSGEEAIGRAFMLVSLLAIVWHLGKHLTHEFRDTAGSFLVSMQNRVRVVMLLIFLTLIALVVYGQVFTVEVVSVALTRTIWVGIGLLLLHQTLLRWLEVARRRLRFAELLAHRSPQETIDESTATVEEQVLGIGVVSAETQQLLTVGTILTAGIGLLYIWSPLLPAIDAFSRIVLWTSTTVVDGEPLANQITLATLLKVATLVVLTLYAASRLPAVVEILMRSRASISPGTRYTVSTLLNYIIVGTGIIMGLSALGVRWGQLQWLVAALGVGIGFGLQEIVANFISGLIILFERPIRVGDIVTIGNNDGVVSRIRIRATTLRDWDGKELLIPNKEFITGRLLNWTLTDPQTRLVIPVGIAYGSDVELALRTLTEVVSSHPAVQKEPEPSILFLGFGDNSLNLVARCWVGKVEQRMPTISELHTSINSAFKEAGIVIAFPQRDVHFDTDRPLRIALESAHGDGGEQ